MSLINNRKGGRKAPVKPVVRQQQEASAYNGTVRSIRSSDKAISNTALTTSPISPKISKNSSEKLQKVLARAGWGSRRELEQWIDSGRVSINGQLAKLGDRVAANAVIRVDGKIIDWQSSHAAACRVLIYYKPEGEICTRADPEGRPTVFDNLPRLRDQRWLSIGRLDINTAGLLLFTNHGELANRLMHPSYEIEREYAVRVIGEITKEQVLQLREGVQLDDGLAHFDNIREAGGEGTNRWYHVILREGRNREVRRLFEALNIFVNRLIRVRFAQVGLPRHLRRGRWMELSPREITDLCSEVKLNLQPYKPSAMKQRRQNFKIKRLPARKPAKLSS